MSVEIDPSELGFRRPFTQEVSQTLRLQNNNEDAVVFKVKTTAPKQYCVRPNNGRIEAGRHVEVQVLLQAMKEDPPPDAKCRDKFLVQSVAITQDQEYNNVASIWQNVEKTAKSSIQERKIRVVFLAAEEGQTPPPDYSANGVAPTPDGAMHTSPVGHFDTPSAYSAATPSRSAPQEETSPSGTEKTENTSPSVGIAAVGGDLKPTTTNSTGASGDDLSSQLSEARAHIQKLKEVISNNEQRKSGDQSRDTTSSGLQQQHQTGVDLDMGVPLRTTTILCLLSFLLAYFFF